MYIESIGTSITFHLCSHEMYIAYNLPVHLPSMDGISYIHDEINTVPVWYLDVSTFITFHLGAIYLHMDQTLLRIFF